MKKKISGSSVVMKVLEALLLVMAAVILFLAIKNTADRSGEEGRKQLENSLRRSVMACYASEGVYPPNLKYLQDHYGLLIDDDKYSVHYEVFAQNIVPEITVLEIEK